MLAFLLTRLPVKSSGSQQFLNSTSAHYRPFSGIAVRSDVPVPVFDSDGQVLFPAFLAACTLFTF